MIHSARRSYSNMSFFTLLVGQANSANESFFGGAPYCYTVYDPAPITDLSLQPGDYFALQPNSTFNDAWCSTNAAKPSLILPPHTSPLDMKFGVTKDDSNLYIGLHGSFDRETTIVRLLFPSGFID